MVFFLFFLVIFSLFIIAGVLSVSLRPRISGPFLALSRSHIYLIFSSLFVPLRWILYDCESVSSYCCCWWCYCRFLFCCFFLVWGLSCMVLYTFIFHNFILLSSLLLDFFCCSLCVLFGAFSLSFLLIRSSHLNRCACFLVLCFRGKKMPKHWSMMSFLYRIATKNSNDYLGIFRLSLVLFSVRFQAKLYNLNVSQTEFLWKNIWKKQANAGTQMIKAEREQNKK